jgi:hypothetical protein
MIDGATSLTAVTDQALRRVLEAAGVEFIDENAVVREFGYASGDLPSETAWLQTSKARGALPSVSLLYVLAERTHCRLSFCAPLTTQTRLTLRIAAFPSYYLGFAIR